MPGDTGRDDDADGLFDRLSIQVLVDVTIPATYTFDVFMQTPGGTPLFATGKTAAGLGLQFIEADLTAVDIVGTGENGPFAYDRIELSRDDPNHGQVLVDRLVIDGALETQAYTITQFERPAIKMIGQFSDTRVDDDADCDFDTLAVLVGVQVREAGTYDYTVELADINHFEIQYLTGQQALLADQPQSLVLNFDGTQIGQHAVDGPYRVRALTIVHPSSRASHIVVNVGQTSPYEVNQFNGFPNPPDCDGDTIPDFCEPDFDADGVPDDCECPGDVDGDFDVDLDDMTLILRAFGSCSGDPFYDARADFDHSGCVDLDDHTILLQNYGQTCE